MNLLAAIKKREVVDAAEVSFVLPGKRNSNILRWYNLSSFTTFQTLTYINADCMHI